MGCRLGLTGCKGILYSIFVIRSFKHKGLAAFFATGSRKGITAAHATKLRLQLTALEHARSPADMNAPGWRLHPLKGELKGSHAVWVSGNWRLVFRFEGSDATGVDYLDYH
jgi:proteic killer suppression protein